MDELNQKFIAWCDHNDVHMNRLVNVTKRHKDVMVGIAHLWLKHHTFPIEEEEKILSLHKELTNICEEIAEVYLSIGDDTQEFCVILDLLRKELERLDGKSKEPEKQTP